MLFEAVLTTYATRSPVTVRTVDPLTEPVFAVTVVLPSATTAAIPVALIVATFVAEEFQVAELVKSCVLPSLNVPVAVNCCCPPKVMDGLEGVTVREISAAVTFSVAVPLIGPEVARIIVKPGPAPLTRPVFPANATFVAEELHVTELVRSLVLLSANVPVAANCCTVPTVREKFAGVTAIDFSGTGPTESVALPLAKNPRVTLVCAVILVVPCPLPMATPLALIPATLVAEELHVTELVMS